MPTPKGWRKEGVVKRDRCAQHLMKRGTSKSSAYAICTAMVEKTGQTDKNGPNK